MRPGLTARFANPPVLLVCLLPLQNLVQLRRTEGLGVLMGARVVEKIDSNTQVWVGGPFSSAAC